MSTQGKRNFLNKVKRRRRVGKRLTTKGDAKNEKTTGFKQKKKNLEKSLTDE